MVSDKGDYLYSNALAAGVILCERGVEGGIKVVLGRVIQKRRNYCRRRLDLRLGGGGGPDDGHGAGEHKGGRSDPKQAMVDVRH